MDLTSSEKAVKCVPCCFDYDTQPLFTRTKQALDEVVANIHERQAFNRELTFVDVYDLQRAVNSVGLDLESARQEALVLRAGHISQC